MKKKILIVSVLSLFIFAITAPAGYAYTRVKSYYTKRGTYVQSHYRTSANSTTYDNWSTKGNVNPYTGKRGYKSSYTYSSPSYRSSSYTHKPSYTYKSYSSSYKSSYSTPRSYYKSYKSSW